MKKLVWIFGVLLVLSFVFPNAGGVTPVPVPIPAPAPPAETDADIVKLLVNAAPEDKGRIISIYTGLRIVMTRDKGVRINNTERWAELQAATLALAVDQVGKYPGLDMAIEKVFLKAIGTDDVSVVTPEVVAKLCKACDIIANSAN